MGGCAVAPGQAQRPHLHPARRASRSSWPPVPPLATAPITADFDEKGRLYVSDSSGSNDKVEEQLEKKPHRIVRLEDTERRWHVRQADRVRRQHDVPRRSDVVRRLALRRRAAAHLEAHRHQRRRRRRQARRSGSTARRSPAAPTTCTARTSGRTAGSTGARGRSPSRSTRCQRQEVHDAGRRTSSARRPDGSGIEPVMTGGMDNPVDRRLHAERRAHLHDDVLPASAATASATG